MAKSSMKFGMYYQTESFVHSLDPRAKIIALFIFLISIFFVNIYAMFVAVYAFGFMMIKLSNVPLAKSLSSVKPVFFILIFTGLINVFFTAGETVLWQGKYLSITEEALEHSILMILRLVALFSFSTVLTYTTTPTAISDAMESLLAPLKRVGFPVHEFAMMMTIALRFIPVLMEETEKITKAQRSRGGDLTTGSMKRRVKGMLAILVPLFFNSLKRADDLALAMESRGYTGGEGRTSLRKLEWCLKDTMALLATIAFAAAIVVVRFV